MIRILAFLCALILAGLGARDAPAQAIATTDYWRYPSAASYTAVPNDSNSVFSAFNAGGMLTITLPANATTPGVLPSGWNITVVNDNGHQVTVQTNATGGGNILFPSGHSVASVTTAPGNYEMLALEFDSSGNFRVIGATPATAVAIGITGSFCITGPNSTTTGYVASWGSTNGCVLATGYPVANSGANTVMETDSSGHLSSSVIANLVTGPGSSTAGYVVQWGNTAGTALATGTPLGNSGANTILETDSSGHISETVLYIDTSLGGHAVCWNGSNFYTSTAC
jgi:hypothetical protein